MDVYLKLEEKEAQFIARELHHLIDGMNIEKERIEKALRIGNKIAEQLSEQRDLPPVLWTVSSGNKEIKIIRETTIKRQQYGTQKKRRPKI